MTFNHFEEEHFSALHQGFLEAFSSYKVPFNLNFDAFQRRMLNKLALVPELSGMVLEDDKCIAFVLQTLGEYEQKRTIYNGGTGVIPGKRGQNLTLQLFDYLAPSLASADASRLLLEVITTNDAALKVYDKLGFQYRRTFRCYKRINVTKSSSASSPVIFKKVRPRELQRYQALSDITPSFIDDSGHLVRNIKNEIILEAELEGKLVGYAIFQPLLGRISQLGVASEARGKGIGRDLIDQIQLLSPGKDLSLINVPDTYQPLHLFLLAMGFQNEIDQYEMELVF